MKAHDTTTSIHHLLSCWLLLTLFIVDGLAVETQDFYITNSSARTIEFSIGAPASTDIASTIIQFNLDAAASGLEFGLTFNGVTISPLTTTMPANQNFGGIIKQIYYSAGTTEYSIIIGHQTGSTPIPIGSETWTISIDNFPATERHVTVTLQSVDDESNEVSTPSTQLTVFPSPAITLTPDPLDFGKKIKGTTATAPITIKNTGTANLRITVAPTISGSQFDFVTPFPADFSGIILKPDEPQNIDIKFITNTPGDHTGTLTVQSNVGVPKTASLHGIVVYGELVLLLDTSGSMGWKPNGTVAPIEGGSESRLGEAKRSAAKFIDILKQYTLGATSLGVAIFPGGDDPDGGCDGGYEPNYAQTLISPIALNNAANADNIKNSVIGCDNSDCEDGAGNPTGIGVNYNGTPIGSGLQEATSAFDFGVTDHQRAIVLLSDGAWLASCTKVGTTEEAGPSQTYGPNPESNAVLNPLISKNVKIYPIAYGTVGDVDVGLLNRLADKTDGDISTNSEAAQYNPNQSATQLSDYFEKILEEIFALDISSDPFVEIKAGQTNEHDVLVTSLDHKVSFSINLGKFSSDLIHISLQTPSGNVIPARDGIFGIHNVKYTRGANYKFFSVSTDPTHHSIEPGEWKLVVTANIDASYTYSTFMESDLHLEANLTSATYFTGAPVLLRVSVREKGRLLNGVTITLHSRRPEKALGNWWAENQITQMQLAEAPVSRNGEYYSNLQRKAYVLINQLSKRPPGAISLPTIVLKDDGSGVDDLPNDGIFAGVLNDTNMPGYYELLVRAEGVTSDGHRFQRESLLHRQIWVNVQPQYSVSKIYFDDLLVTDDLIRKQIKLVPQDIYGNLVGPGFDEFIDFKVTGGRWLEENIQDDLSGGYYRTLEYDPRVEIPIISPVVQNKTFMPTLVPTVAPLRPGNFMAQVGNLVTENDLFIGDGVTYAVRFGRQLNSSFGWTIEIGATSAVDKTDNSGSIIQALGNLEWRVAGSQTRFTPFLNVGAGMVGLTGFFKTENKPAYVLGGGFVIQLAPGIFGRFEMRDLIVNDNELSTGTTNNIQTLWGIGYSF